MFTSTTIVKRKIHILAESLVCIDTSRTASDHFKCRHLACISSIFITNPSSTA